MFQNINPEWEEEELRELQTAEAKQAASIKDGKRLGAAIHKADVAANGRPEPLNIVIPAWWLTWQAFASEANSYIKSMSTPEDDAKAYDIGQACYERGWTDAVATVEAAIQVTAKGEV